MDLMIGLDYSCPKYLKRIAPGQGLTGKPRHPKTPYAVARFTAGTPILVSLDGQAKLVEEIDVGERILAHSEHDPDGPLELKLVEEVLTRVSPVLRRE